MNIVISGENRWDDYGNFFFKDKAGNEHKIGTKRKNQVELVAIIEDNPAKAVSLTMAEYQGKEYIVGIELVSGQLETSKPQEAPQPSKVAPQELGMWWKEMGNRIGDGSIEKDFPKSAIRIKGQYYKQMETVTGITFKEES